MNDRDADTGSRAPVFGGNDRRAEPHTPGEAVRLQFDQLENIEYKEVAENLPTLCWIAAADGYITWYNRRWHEYCGTTPEQMEGWGWQSVHDPDVLPGVMERWTGSIASGEPFEMVFPLRGADGVFRPFLTRVVPVRDVDGSLRSWIGNNVDISEQVRSELELRQSQERLEAVNRTLAEREAFLSSVLSSSTDCIKVLDLEGRLTFMSEGGQKVMEVSDFGTIAGCPWPDFWRDQGNVEALAAIKAANAGGSHNFVGRAETMAGNPRWWDVAVSPIRGSDGEPEGILSVSRDITASRENEEARDQLARIVENSADFIGMARLDGSVFFLNDAACRLVGFDRADIATVTIADFFPPEEAEIVRDEVLPAVARDNFWSGERLFRHFDTGELIPVLYTVFPVNDHDGKLMGYATVTRDIRNRKRAEAQQRLLNDELSHRLKNVLAVVQSVAAQTLRQAADLPSANAALTARLAALGQATDVLTARSWASADLRQVVDRALAPYGGVGERIRVAGPSIMLLPQVTLAFALALHELATNAVKYGALSAPGGHVDLNWSITEGSNGEKPRFHLLWQEVGGPAVQTPSRRGFGSMMIERSLRSYFRGHAQLEYPTSGLVFRLDAALGDAGKMDS